MRRTLILGTAVAASALAVPAGALAHDRGDDDRPASAPEQIGTVASFTDGVLTIKLADGSTLTAKVSDRTRIACESATTTATPSKASLRRRGGGDDNGGDRDGGSRRHGGHGHWSGKRCSTTDLTAGTAVNEAEVSGTTTGAVYRKVDLIK
jgi:hypothetical protein